MLEGRHVSPLVANNTSPRTEKDEGQNNSFKPTLSRYSPKLVSVANAAASGQ
jgi:hypothetical protein